MGLVLSVLPEDRKFPAIQFWLLNWLEPLISGHPYYLHPSQKCNQTLRNLYSLSGKVNDF